MPDERNDDSRLLTALDALESIYKSLPVGLCVLDRQLRYVRINDRLARMNGLPPEAHIGRTIREVVPDVADIVEGIAERVFSSGEPELVTEGPGFSTEHPGRMGMWRAAWLPVKAPGGRIVGLSVSVEDVTARRDAEDELRRTLATLERRVAERTAALAESERKYRDLAENTRDIPFQIDRDGVLVYLGPQVLFYGLDPTQMMGKHFAPFVHDDDRGRALKRFKEALAFGERQSLLFRMATPLQGERWFEERGVVQRDTARQATGVIGILRDVTETVQKDEALRESEEKYRSLFEMETGGIILTDVETRQVLDVNQAALQLYGYTREEFLQLDLMTASAEPEATLQFLARLRRDGRADTPLRWHLRKDGTRLPLEIHAVLMSLRGREIIFAVVRDISDRLAREEENRRQRVALERLAGEVTVAAEQERQRIATSLHDHLVQMLVACQMRIDQLVQAPHPRGVKPGLKRVWEILDQAARDARTLTFTLAQPGVEVIGLPAALEQLCRELTAQYGLPFSLRVDGDPARLSAEPCQVVFRCARELAMNAGRHARATQVKLSIAATPQGARLTVEDDGCGFDARQAGSGFSSTGGFGLFSIRKQLQSAGMALSIESTPEQGTRVTIDVPQPGTDAPPA